MDRNQRIAAAWADDCDATEQHTAKVLRALSQRSSLTPYSVIEAAKREREAAGDCEPRRKAAKAALLACATTLERLATKLHAD